MSTVSQTKILSMLVEISSQESSTCDGHETHCLSVQEASEKQKIRLKETGHTGVAAGEEPMSSPALGLILPSLATVPLQRLPRPDEPSHAADQVVRTQVEKSLAKCMLQAETGLSVPAMA